MNAESLANSTAPLLAIVFAAGALFYSVWDSRHSDGDPDDQIGIKIVILALCLFALATTISGVQLLVHYALSMFKSPGLKPGAALLVSGGAIFAGLFFVFFPRTNHQDHPKSTRMALGVAALASGLHAVEAFSNFVTLTIQGGGWASLTEPLSSVVVYGGAFLTSILIFGEMSSWTKIVRTPKVAPPNQGYAQPGGMQGYPPQGGMPPQGGGYPPQGGMPPQGGGYPPQGGMPPQGGGYPPQGGMPPQGGGYPPQGGGGGYPPR